MTQRADDFARLIVRENGRRLPTRVARSRTRRSSVRWYAEEAVRAEGHVQTALPEPTGFSCFASRSGERPDHAVELPRGDGDTQDRTRAGGGMHRRAQAASDTPLTALAMGALLAEAGVPAGVVNVLPSRRSGLS